MPLIYDNEIFRVTNFREKVNFKFRFSILNGRGAPLSFKYDGYANDKALFSIMHLRCRQAKASFSVKSTLLLESFSNTVEVSG